MFRLLRRDDNVDPSMWDEVVVAISEPMQVIMLLCHTQPGTCHSNCVKSRSLLYSLFESHKHYQ